MAAHTFCGGLACPLGLGGRSFAAPPPESCLRQASSGSASGLTQIGPVLPHFQGFSSCGWPAPASVGSPARSAFVSGLACAFYSWSAAQPLGCVSEVSRAVAQWSQVGQFGQPRFVTKPVSLLVRTSQPVGCAELQGRSWLFGGHNPPWPWRWRRGYCSHGTDRLLRVTAVLFSNSICFHAPPAVRRGGVVNAGVVWDARQFR